MQYLEGHVDDARRWLLPLGDARLEEARPGVEARQTMARARDDAEQLRRAVEEVDDLRDEQEQQRLGEVAKDGYDGEDHAGEVTVGVADEDAGWVPIVVPERERDANEGEEKVEGEEMRVRRWVRVRGREQVDGVVEDEEKGDDERLADLDAVDACQDVYAVGTEYGNACHVDVVGPAEIEEGT